MHNAPSDQLLLTCDGQTFTLVI